MNLYAQQQRRHRHNETDLWTQIYERTGWDKLREWHGIKWHGIKSHGMA